MQAVTGWMKGNLVIVVCVVVIIGAPAGLWYVSSGLSEELLVKVKKRGGQLDKLASAGKAQFAWPGSSDSVQVIVTPDLVAAYQQQASTLQGQADDIVSEANTRNKAGFENPFPELLPYPSADTWMTLTQQGRDAELFQALQIEPERMHARLMELYDALLKELNAGDPPDPVKVKAQLALVRADSILGGSNEQSLDEDERKELDRKLADKRLQMYIEAAEWIGIYLTPSTLEPPNFAKTDTPDHQTIARWMWRYWVLQRLVAGIQTANDQGQNETEVAIKRLDRIDVRGLLEMQTPSAGDRSFAKGAGDGNRGGGRGGGTGGNNGGGSSPPRGGPGGPPRGPSGGGPPAGPSGGPGGGGSSGGFGGPVGPAAPAPGTTDRSKSVTGRITNQLYDVVLVDLDMIVATDRLDTVLTAFSKPIETAVLDVVVEPIDSFEDLKQGYYYGSGSMSRVVLTVETIWLRQWTQSHLPDGVRSTLGFAPRQYPASASDNGAVPGGPPGRPGMPGRPVSPGQPG